MAKRREIKSHKKATDLNLTGEMEQLLGMSVGSDSMKLKSADDLSEPDEKVEKSSVAAVEATINYVNKLLNESDEELPEDNEELPEDDEELPEDPEDQVDDEDSEMDDSDPDIDAEDEDDVEECDGKYKFSEDDDLEDDADPEDEDEDLDVDADMEDDDDESLDDMEDEEEDDMDDVSESYRFLFEDDGSLADDSDEEEMGDDEDSFDDDSSEGGLSIDIPEDIDPNDVSVSVGGSEYVPDVDDEGEGEEDDLGNLDDDELGGEEEDDEEDMPVQEGFFRFGEDDDPDIDDVEPSYDDDEFDDEDEDEDEDLDDTEEDDGEVTESAVMRALRKLIREGERSDDAITADPSNSTGDAPIDSEADVDDSTAEEKDLSGDEGEVEDGDIPITPGTIQPEEAAELKWMARKLKKIMEGDDLDSHSDGEGKVAAEPLDGDAQDMIGDISDELSDDGELTDTGNGAVEDGEITLGDPDDADEDVEVDGDDVVSSNGEKYDTEEDEDEMLTDNYHMLMTAIKEAYAKKKAAKKDKKVALKKVDKKKAAKKKGKKLSENSFNKTIDSGDISNDRSFNAGSNPSDARNITGYGAVQNGVAKETPEKLSENKGKTLENTVLGSFNAQEMTSVLRNLNNAFGTGKIAKEVRDASVVSEVSVPKWSLPIAENATWDSLKAGKLLSETAYKSESKVNFDLMKKSHLYWENDGSKESDYKFPIASIVEGQAQIIPEAITEATKLFASPSFITRFSESALKKIRNVLDFYNGKMGKTSPWKENKQLNVTEAAKITMIDRTQYNPLMVLKRLSEQEKARNLINLRG